MTDYDPSEVAILVPILGRPHLVEPLKRNVENVTPDPHLLFIPDVKDDESIEACYDCGAMFTLGGKTWAEKINWVTSQLGPRFRYIFCAADDVLFHDGWLDKVMAVMGTHNGGRVFIEDAVRVVGTRDLLTANVEAGDHATHYMVDRRYIDKVGGVIDEGPGSFLPTVYRHNYTDSEFIETAKKRGVFAPSTAVVEHLHPLAGKAMHDATYRIGDESKAADAAIFESRRHLWA